MHEQSAASAAHFQAQLDERGFGFWAVEVRGSGEFIGFTGLDQVDEGMPFTGIEIGWPLRSSTTPLNRRVRCAGMCCTGSRQ